MPFGLESSFNAIKLFEEPPPNEHDLTDAEKELLQKHKGTLTNFHKNRFALPRGDRARGHGVEDSDSDNELGGSVEKTRKPKRGQRKDESLPTLGVLSQSEFEVIQYR